MSGTGRGDRRGEYGGPPGQGGQVGQSGQGGQSAQEGQTGQAGRTGQGGQPGQGYNPAGYGNQGYQGLRPAGAPSGPHGQPGPNAQPFQNGPQGPNGQPGQPVQWYPAGQGYGPQGYNGRPRGGAAYPESGGFDRPASYPPGALGSGQQPSGQGYGPGPGPGYGNQGYNGQGSGNQGYGGQGYGGPPGPGGQGYGAQGYGGQPGQPGYGPQGYGNHSYAGPGYAGTGYADPSARGQAYRGYGDQPTQSYGYQQGPGGPGGPGDPGPDGPGQGPQRKVRFRRTRRLARLRSVRIAGALVGVFLIWVMFSVGQALTANNGQSMSSNLAEWARDHYLGPLVTFGEWLSYNPPKTGGKPSFSLAIPKGQQVTSGKKAKGFQPDIPATLKSLAGAPLPGEGQWRVVEKVKGEPAIFTTFLRDATYTSYVNGIASMDQRLVSFQLHPGSEDPGPGNWGEWGSDYIAPGSRTGLVATFNGGFKLDSAGGGWYLNGEYHGSLVTGEATIVYYKNGTIKIGEWGRDFSMNSSIEGVRQNLKLLIDHGAIEPNLNQNVETNFGATLGGGYYVWRSGLGITKDGRIIYVYGPALNVQDLADLLQRAGAVEGMQLDINPYWMKYEYYTANGNASDPTPVNLLPTQQQSAYSYYSTYTRDFTAVYAR